MDTRERQRAIEGLSHAAKQLERVAFRLKCTVTRLGARAGGVQIRRRRSGVPWGASRPIASPRAKAPFRGRGEHATADATGRLHACSCGAPGGRCLGLRRR